MNELNRAELRRLAEAATGGDWEFRLGLIRTMVDSDGYVPVAIAPNCPKNWRGQRDTNMEHIAAANPSAVLALLDELESLRAQVGTLTEWYSNALNVIADVTAAIPGVTYMDLPDGGDVSIPEQIRRMAKDAERYRWLRTADWWSSPLCVIRDPKQQAKPGTDCPSRDRLDSAIDAAMSQERSQ